MHQQLLHVLSEFSCLLVYTSVPSAAKDNVWSAKLQKHIAFAAISHAVATLHLWKHNKMPVVASLAQIAQVYAGCGVVWCSIQLEAAVVVVMRLISIIVTLLRQKVSFKKADLAYRSRSLW